MGMAHVGLVHRDPCECKVKDFPAVSSIERNESKKRHLQGVRQERDKFCKGNWEVEGDFGKCIGNFPILGGIWD